ncbi:MAG: VacJ family lipoprotein [Rhodospirillales bacterium]|nr:VacJ family lipoprotein [Rhodospirillales bacterium]MSP80336.1 VacJ family lipoprotein [Rhodospirillales bacterium]
MRVPVQPHFRAALVASVFLGFGAPANADDPAAANDSLELINRVTSEFNAVLRKGFLDPLVEGFRAVMPDDMQKAVSNVFSNLSEPVTVGSSLLQGDTDNASTATKRFFINTFAGVGGLGDPATEAGLKQRREDLGQAMGASGIAPGPHIVLPIFGPSNLRDATGDILVGLVNPAPLALKAADAGISYADKKDIINAATEGALDRYTVERNAYEQHRRFLVNNGEGPAIAFPDINADEKESVAETRR